MIRLIRAMADIETGTVEIAEPELQTRTLPSLGDLAGDWLCAWCLNRVANEKDRFTYDGQSEFAFKNPQGIHFHIITFAQTIGCREAGAPTLEFTWFPEHAWSFCLCNQCRMHLGWYYAGPNTFAGLIRDRIVRASLVMN
ncbi:MAG: cereblon family protein [Verrucomicrobiota bacterium]